MPRLLDRRSRVLVVAATAVALAATGCAGAPAAQTPAGSVATFGPSASPTLAPATATATATGAATANASVPPTASPTACTPIAEPSGISATLAVNPVAPKVGQKVTLSFTVKGGGGLPQYVLGGSAPVFSGTVDPLYSATNGTVDWTVTAARAGTAKLTLQVTYEARVGCEENPVFTFLSDHSGPFSVTVAP